jgi:hypothetical protein
MFSSFYYEFHFTTEILSLFNPVNAATASVIAKRTAALSPP